MARTWIAVASADHVRIGLRAGFMQVCHGKAAPLRRISPGDRVIYYSPTVTFGGRDRLQAFTATGLARDTAPYQVEMSPGFCPWRRDVAWEPGVDIAIRPLLPSLALAKDDAGWGYQFRFGLFAIQQEDADLIVRSMRSGVS